MQYGILDADGNHIRESRGGRSSRTTDGLYGMNRKTQEQKAQRRFIAEMNMKSRGQRSVQEQLDIIAQRPGQSARETERLESLLNADIQAAS